MRYFRNVDIVQEFLVNEATVRKWIRDTRQGKIDLELCQQNSRTYIANTLKNIETIRELVEGRRKFRNSKAMEFEQPQNQFFGVWLSEHYKMTAEPDAPRTHYYVTIRRQRNQLIVESLPDTESNSYLFARFTLEGNVATGMYQSQNDPHTRAKDALYYGSAQLILDDDGKALRGMGVGFDKDMKATATIWNITYVGETVPAAK